MGTSGSVTVDGGEQLAVGWIAQWLDDDRIIFSNEKVETINVNTGERKELWPRGVNDLAANGGKWLGWSSVDGLIGDVPDIRGLRTLGGISPPYAGGRGAIGRDGTLALTLNRSIGTNTLLWAGRAVDVGAVAYGLQVLGPDSAIWTGGSFNAPAPPEGAVSPRICGAWMVYYKDGLGLVAQRIGTTRGKILTRGDAFNHDAVSDGEDVIVAWSTTTGEGRHDLVKRRIWDIAEEELIAPLPAAWPVTPRTQPEIFYPFHTCSSRESERGNSPDGTGLLKDYPANVIGPISNSGDLALAAQTNHQLMLGGLAWPTDAGRKFGEDLKASGLQSRVLTLWAAPADENPVQSPSGDPSRLLAEIADAEIARWRALFPNLPAPPVLGYVVPQHVQQPTWFRPSSVGVWMPQFYFSANTQSVEQIERELWAWFELYLSKLGTSKPWIPVWQCFRRAWDQPTNMPLIARLQTRFFEAAREMKQRGAPIIGNAFFAVLRREGAIQYPEAQAAHREMALAIPAGPLPLKPPQAPPVQPPVNPPTPPAEAVTLELIYKQARTASQLAFEAREEIKAVRRLLENR